MYVKQERAAALVKRWLQGERKREDDRVYFSYVYTYVYTCTCPIKKVYMYMYLHSVHTCRKEQPY